MSKRKIVIYSILFGLGCLAWLFSNSRAQNDAFSERVKIALREAGNQLLLNHQDSTSLILPIIALSESKYELSFEKDLSFEPNNLVRIIDSTFIKTNLAPYYRVEVIQCIDEEVAYSYQMTDEEESTIIPCAGRYLPLGCYVIEVTFTKPVTTIFYKTTVLFALLLLVIFFSIDYLWSKRKSEELEKNADFGTYTSIGRFQFYPEQNKLVKEAEEIPLSRKECELLELFVAHPNQVIKRDELTKKVWEDNGVFVGRSLDTYISKLRKKLKDDEAIKLVNVHGIGYKLEVN